MSPRVKQAIDDKRYLLKFFAAKEHRNLVLRIVDVLELRNDYQDWLIDRCCLGMPMPRDETRDAREASGWRKRILLQTFPGGNIVLPLEELLGPMEMTEVVMLQEICMAYHGIRQEKGEPSRVDPCGKCNGKGRNYGQKCKDCDGGGKIITFLEMSDEERRLAMGAPNE